MLEFLLCSSRVAQQQSVRPLTGRSRVRILLMSQPPWAGALESRGGAYSLSSPNLKRYKNLYMIRRKLEILLLTDRVCVRQRAHVSKVSGLPQCVCVCVCAALANEMTRNQRRSSWRANTVGSRNVTQMSEIRHKRRQWNGRSLTRLRLFFSVWWRTLEKATSLLTDLITARELGRSRRGLWEVLWAALLHWATRETWY